MKKFLFNILTVFFLMTIPPIGIFFMFRFTSWHDGVKKSVAVIWSIIWVFAIYISTKEMMMLAQTGA